MAGDPAQPSDASPSAPSSSPVAVASSPTARNSPLLPVNTRDLPSPSPSSSPVRGFSPQPLDVRRVRFGGHTVGPLAGTTGQPDASPVLTVPTSAATGGPRVMVRAPPSDGRIAWRRPNAPTSLPLSGSHTLGPSPLAGPSTLPTSEAESTEQPGRAQLPAPPLLSRRNHPGPLNLAERLPQNAEHHTTQPLMHRMAHDAKIESPIFEEPMGRVHSNDSAQQQQPPALADLGVRELNARGLDGKALVELQAQLNKLRAGWPTDGAGVSYAASDAPDAPDASGAPSRDPSDPMSDPSRDQSGSITPSDASYNPLTDSDLGHVPILEGEVDGMPARVRRSDMPQDGLKEGLGEARANVKSFFRKPFSVLRGKRRKPSHNDDDFEKVEEGRADQSSRRDGKAAGATNRKSVPVTTSTGLRGTGAKPKPTKYERQAARLVRAHRFLSGQGGHRDNSSSDLSTGAPPGDMLFPDPPAQSAPPVPPVPPVPTAPPAPPAPSAPPPDAGSQPLDPGAAESEGSPMVNKMDARPTGSGGVLGHLLMLYEQQQREQQQAKQGQQQEPPGSELSAEGGKSTYPLGSSQPPSSLDSAHGPRPNPLGVKRRPLSRMGSVLESTTSSATGGGTRYPKRGSHLLHESRQAIRHAEGAVASATAVVMGDYEMEDRPRAARSGAGVFGALVTTANNLIGVASPAAAQLGPNPFRPGFTLDRYLLPEMNAKTMRRTAKIIASASDPPPRPMPPARTSGILRTPGAYRGSGRPTPATSAMTTPQSELGPRPDRLHEEIMPVTGAAAVPSAPASPHVAGVSSALRSTGEAALHPWKTITAMSTPAGSDAATDYFGPGAAEQLRWQQKEARQNKEEWQRKVRKRAKRTKKEEVYVCLTPCHIDLRRC